MNDSLLEHKPSRERPVAIIGAGLAGLAAAATLAARGYPVVVFERNQWLGGKAAIHEKDGFRFDMGPTILTLPIVLKRIFAEAGRDLASALDLIRLDPQWRCFFADGSVLDLTENMAAMTSHLEAFGAGKESATGYAEFIALSERLHQISERFFFWRSVDDVRDMFDLKQNFNAQTLSDVLALRMGSSVAKTIRSHVPDARVAQMLDHFTQYVGSSPFNSPAVLCSIAHMQTSGGIWYPKGGTGAVPKTLAEMAKSLGARFETTQTIKQIHLSKGRVEAVETDRGERIAVSAVVSNMDAVRTYRELIGGEIGAKFLRRRKRRLEPACSGVVLYLGLKERYEQLEHHNFVFSADPHQEFDFIYRQGEPALDPTCYVAAPAKTEPGVAPSGGEALYILVHTPYLRPHHDWQTMFKPYRDVIIDKMKRTAGLADLEQRIVTEHYLTPQDIHDRYSVLNGAIYGLASHGKFFGAFKPGNRSRDVPGLYLAGGAAHPGPGMPMVLMSGWIAADSLDQDYRITEPAGGNTQRNQAA